MAFDASTTIYRLAAATGAPRDLVVVTNGRDTFNAINRIPVVTAALSGGTEEPWTGSLVGPAAVRAAQNSGGTWTWLDSEEVPVTADMWLKCEVEGENLRTKVGPVGTSEPGTWDLEETHSQFATGRSGTLLLADRHVDVLIDDYSLEGVE